MLQVLNKVEIDLSTNSSTKNQQPDINTHLLVQPYKVIQGKHAKTYSKWNKQISTIRRKLATSLHRDLAWN